MQVFEYDKLKSQRDYYTRNAVFWGLFAGYIPFTVLTGSLLELVFGLKGGIGYAAVAWMIVWVIVAFWRIYWPCPRCHKRFYFKWWYGNTFTTKCVHCGFRPGQPSAQ